MTTANATPTPVRALLSAALAILLVGYVLFSIGWSAFVSAIASVNFVAFAALTVTSTVALLVADAWAIRQVYREYVCAITFRQTVAIRGASYLPQLLNYHVGQAWMTWFAARTHGVALRRVAGATLLIYATMFGGVFLLAATAYLFGGAATSFLGPTLAIVALSAASYAVLLVVRPERLRRLPALEVLFEAGLVGNLRALAYRLPHTLVLFAGMWAPFALFQVRIPWTDALARIPPLMLVGALPLTPQGLGTRDALAVQLLAAYGPGAGAVAATTLCWAVGMTVVHCLMSPFLLREAHRWINPVETPNAQDSPHR